VIPAVHIVSLWTLAAPPTTPLVPPEAEEVVVEMTSVSVFELGREADFIGGEGSSGALEPSEEITGYPELVSGAPLYGAVNFSSANHEGGEYFWVLDESDGTGTGYDLLYLDRDLDLDLAREEPLKRLEDPPVSAIDRYSSIVQQACFELLEIPCHFGEAGERPVEVMPRLTIREYDDGERIYRDLAFIGTRAWRGSFEVGGDEFVVHLGHDRTAVRPFDGPQTAMFLSRRSERSSLTSWLGGNRLSAMHELGGTFYGFAADPTGERLIVRPYGGALGEFAIGAGGRELETMKAQGSLRSAEHAVAIGSEAGSGWPEPVERCRIPVGDYYPYYLTIQFGELSIQISNNYHSDGGERGVRGGPVFGFEIRENRPFTLDFGNEPDVIFASPRRDLRLKPGETLEVSAVLVDPELDIMIRDLDDESERVEEVVEFADGETQLMTTSLSLEPRVIITRKNGEKLAEGDMPFG